MWVTSQCRAIATQLPPSLSQRRAAITSTPTGRTGTDEYHAYCKDFVQRHDYEAYLVSRLYPVCKRSGYFAIKAFYDELAMIQDNVSSSIVGEMRIQFWRDAVKALVDGRPPHHPIALALHDTWRNAQLQPYHLRRIVDARSEELRGSSHLTMDSVMAHAEATASTHYYLLLSLLGLSSDTFLHAASHLGVAHCISTLLRALPYHASKGRMVIPAEITARHGVIHEDVALTMPVFDFATVANDNVVTAREMFKEEGAGRVPQDAMPVFGAGVPIASFLERLEAVNFNAFHPSLQGRSWKLPWRVWRSYYKRTF
ncbi:isoprenoid synthase domain-containing protein [Russula earlei]|uniref:Isoprenoid synthase domain-containing protein n=1 Tax=Russula earlei TaxID=71964 RepID=A0ACC0TR98_9AGAM|nr:isoprenoid synthase domain-containing protein [Russula earlei]